MFSRVLRCTDRREACTSLCLRHSYSYTELRRDAQGKPKCQSHLTSAGVVEMRAERYVARSAGEQIGESGAY